jgi:hypothetical protein
MTSAADQGQSLSAEQRACIAACIACRDACQKTLEMLRGADDRASLTELLRECADQCDRTATALRADRAEGVRLMGQARDVSGRLARLLIEEYAEDKRLDEVCAAAQRCAESCMEAVTRDVSVDKVSADSFPASDPPAR